MPEQNVLIDMNLKLTFERQLRARLNTFHEKQVKAMVHSVNANDDVPDFAGDEPELTNILYTHFESIGVVFANRINQMVLTEIEKDLTPVDAKMFNEDVEIKAKRKLPKVPVVVDRYFRVRASNVAGKITKTTQKEARRVLAAVRKLHDKGAKVGVVPVNLASTSGRMFRTTLNGRASGIVRMNTNGPAEAVKLTQVQLLRGEEPSLSGAGTTSKGTKRWSNMADSLVRGPTTGSQFNHQRANQTVKINEPFIVSGEQLRFPGDESLGASLGNVINCRCAVSYNIKEVAKKVKKHAKNLRSSPSVAIEDLTGQAVVRGTGPFAIADDVPLNSIMNVQGKIDPEYLMELERSWAALPPEVRQLCKETNLKIRVGETLESLLGQNLDTQLGAYAVDKGEIYLGNYVTHNGTRSAILDRASDTLRHEIGHHIDYTLRDYLGLRGSKAKKFKEAWQAARVANAGDDGLNYYFTHSSLDRNMEESFAEAFRSAFNPSKPGKIGFSKNAQGFYFDKNMKDVVEVVRAQIDDYIQMRTRGSLIKSPLTGIVTKPKVVPTKTVKATLPKASESPDFAMKTLNKRLTAKKMEALDDYETYLRNKAGLKESELLNAIDGLEEYIGDSENINSVLRTGHLFEDRGLSVAQVKKQIKAIDKAISLGVTAEDTVVYRGLSGHAARIVNPKVGMEFVDDAIGSWSGERVTAANFMRRTEYGISKIDPDAVMFRMKLKKGSNSLFLDADEAEFLLPRGTKYRIVEIEDNVPVMRKTSFKKGQSPSVNRRVATVEIIPEGEVASPVTKLAKKKVVKKKAAVKKKVAKRKRPLNDATSPKVKATLPKASESPDFDVINIESQFSPNDSIIARLKPFDEVLPAKQRAATIDAIDNYVTDSDFINSYLRTGKEITLDPGDIVPTVAEIKNSVKLIDTAISGAKVQEDITVYRGITSSSVARINPKIGMEFSDKGFGSWSGHRELAAEFMGKTTDTKTAIIRMRLNKGDKALFLNTDESEFLLPRNMRYKILDIEENVAVDVIDDIIKRRVITVEPIF